MIRSVTVIDSQKPQVILKINIAARFGVFILSLEQEPVNPYGTPRPRKTTKREGKKQGHRAQRKMKRTTQSVRFKTLAVALLNDGN